MPKTKAAMPKLEDYEVLQTIGTGSFGTCKKVRRRTDGKVLVWKEIDYGGMSEKEKQLLVQEVNLLRELRHQHIVRYYDRIIDRSESTLYIVTEYCSRGDLAAFIARHKADRQPVEEVFVWRTLHQLLLALHECHKKRSGVHKVLHRDLKPANVFLDDQMSVKLGDFGLARVLHHNLSLAKTFVGTPYYMSPEQLDERGYDERSDLWSLGCLVYELCSLSPPFTAPNQRLLTVKIKDGAYRPIPPWYSHKLQSVISGLLKTDPASRPDLPSLMQTVDAHLQRRGEGGGGGGREGEEEGFTGVDGGHACAGVNVPTRMGRREGGIEEREREGIARDDGECASRREEKLRLWERALQEKEKQLKAWERKLRERERLLAKNIRRQHVLARSPLEVMKENKFERDCK